MIFDCIDELFDYFEVVHDLSATNFFLQMDSECLNSYHVHIINSVDDGNLVVGEQVAELFFEDFGVELLWSSLLPIKPEYVVYEIYKSTKGKPLHVMLSDMVHQNNAVLSTFYWDTNDGYYDTYLWIAEVYLKFTKNQNNRNVMEI